MIKVEHKGFKLTGMVGGMNADIRDTDGCVEITLVDGGHKRGFDLNGLQMFIEDLCHVRNYAEQVDRCNKENREGVSG